MASSPHASLCQLHACRSRMVPALSFHITESVNQNWSLMPDSLERATICVSWSLTGSWSSSQTCASVSPSYSSLSQWSWSRKFIYRDINQQVSLFPSTLFASDLTWVTNLRAPIAWWARWSSMPCRVGPSASNTQSRGAGHLSPGWFPRLPRQSPAARKSFPSPTASFLKGIPRKVFAPRLLRLSRLHLSCPFSGFLAKGKEDRNIF